MSRGRILLILLTALLTLAAAGGSAGDRSPRDVTAAEAYRRTEELRSRLVWIEQRLRSTDPKTSRWALRASNTLYREMLSIVVSGEGAERFFATVLLFRAVAEARLGDLEAAAWHWQSAQGLAVELREIAPRSFPDLAEFLREHHVPKARTAEATGEAAPQSSQTPPEEAGTSPAAGVSPPELVRRVDPEYPRAAWTTGRSGKTAVEVVIDGAGVPHAPIVTASCGVIGFDVAAMEAFRQWRFKPAHSGGKPVSVYYTLTVTYVHH